MLQNYTSPFPAWIQEAEQRIAADESDIADARRTIAGREEVIKERQDELTKLKNFVRILKKDEESKDKEPVAAPEGG